MKHRLLRRLGALALAFALALSLAAPAMAAAVSVEIQGESTLKVDGTLKLRANVTGLAQGETVTGYQWRIVDPAGSLTIDDDKAQEVTLRIPAGGTTLTEGSKVKVSVEATYAPLAGGGGTDTKTVEATRDVTIAAADPPPVTVESISLPQAETVEIGVPKTLALTKVPADAVVGEVTWSSSEPTVATVDENGTVTALKDGETTITAETQDKNGSVITANCKVTVPPKAVYATGISFSPDTVQIDQKDSGAKVVSAIVTPNNCNQVVEWITTDTDESVIKAEPEAGSANGRRVLLRAVGPGETKVTARVKAGDVEGVYKEAVLKVTVSGIKIANPPASLKEGQDYYLRADLFGQAKVATGSVRWSSDDPATVSVGASNGRLTTLKTGSTVIRVTKGDYSAECKVVVEEDTSAIVDVRGAFNPGKPLVMTESEYAVVDNMLMTLPGALNSISLAKTEVRDADNNVVTPASPLSYIANVSVPTAQGTLYYNYNSEANTGQGVGIADRFYYGAAPVGRATLGQLTFVPRQGFSGTAEITFNGYAVNGSNFSGVIRVTVNGTGDGGSIYYGAISGQPADFQVDDFNAYCQAVTGQNLNYVTFTLPAASTGTLYYNYTGSSQSGTRVTANTQYSRTGRTNISGVSFVSNQGYVGNVSISFRGVNTAGTSFTGTVEINVGTSSAGADAADVVFTAVDGKQAALLAGDFNDACRSVLGETLSYVRFQLPSSNDGVLYYNYRSGGSNDSRVDETTRYYYSGVPGIGNITFVAAANAAGQIAVPYTGYSASGATYTGTMYINLQAENQQTIHYFVDKMGLVAFQVNDFNNVCLRQTGYSMDYVRFNRVPTSTASGSPRDMLYYNYRSNITYNTRVTTYSNYYRSYDSRHPSYNLLGNISYLAGSSAGTVSIPYTIYANTSGSGGARTVNGTVLIHVGAVSPADVTLSGTTSSQVWLPSSAIRSVCSAVMDRELSYIEITSLPGEKQGRVYRNYSGYGTGTEVATGTRYYRAGSPSIDQLSFVPYGGFNGTATITYIGYSRDGVEQVSGQIKVTIRNSTTSRYFNDMGRHTWAADAVDFLYVNNISNGVGGGRYSPGGTLIRGDFTLMLIRTFGLTSDKIYSYSDVPATSYYARAISTAKILGITVGDSGGKFYPKQAISRQDAMVMLYNAMKVSGKTMTNGLAADLSGFSDRGSIASYAVEAVGTLVQMGVVKGDGNGRLRPTGTLTRAETAILLQYVLTL